MTELVPRPTTDTWVDVLPSVGDLASKIAATSFVPKGLRGQPASVAAAILTGRELNLGPMAALRGLEVIDGSVTMKPEMMAARILAAGHSIQWVEATDKACTVRIVRGDGLSEAEARFTLADAQRAGLAHKKNWQQWPGQMCRARALANAARMACPDVILGLDVADPGEAATPPAGGLSRVALTTATPEPSDVAETPQEPPAAAPEPVAPEPPAELVTKAQLRKLNAQVTQLERLSGQSLGKDERRTLIAEAGGADPGIDSATKLTVVQASAAIESLDRLIGEQMSGEGSPPDTGGQTGTDPTVPTTGDPDVVDAEIVDADSDTGEVLR